MSDAERDLEFGMMTVGQRLRRAREQKDLTLDDVAHQTRIPVRHLRSIEDGNWDDLPAITYTIGFGRAYANAVGLDGAEIGRELRRELGPAERPQAQTDYYEPSDPSRSPSRLLVWIALIVAIALVVFYMWWRGQNVGDDLPAPPEAAPADQAPAENQAAPAPPPAPSNAPGQQVTLVAVSDVWLQVNDPSQRQAIRIVTLRAGERYDIPLTLQAPVLRTGHPEALRILIAGNDRGLLDTRQRVVSNISLLSASLGERLSAQAAAQTPAPGNQAAPAPAPTTPAPAGNGFAPLL